MDWFRWHHGSVNDPKFQWVARKAGVRVADVIAVWAAILERASMSNKRGELSGFDPEDMDVLFGFDDGCTDHILSVMRDKGILTGDCVTNWSIRQPLREDSSTAERKRRQRDNAASALVSNIPQHCPTIVDTVPQEQTDVTQCHAMSRNVTKNSARLDKIRLEEKEPKTLKPSAAKKPATSPTGDFKTFSAWWCMAFSRIEGYDYIFEGGKDGDIIKKLLARCNGLKPLISRACRFFILEDTWLDEKRSVSMFLNHINKCPPITNGDMVRCRENGLMPPDGVLFEDWKFWENSDES